MPSSTILNGPVRYMAEGGPVLPARTLNVSPAMRDGIYKTALALQLSPAEVATIMAFETGGSMNPLQGGPTTKHGTHRGLIQFGEPQAKQFGVDFTDYDTALSSQLGESGAVVKYALANGFVPGKHSALDLYSAINAGEVGRNLARDAAAGGTPGTVADKYFSQMEPYRKMASAAFPEGAPAPDKPADEPSEQDRRSAALSQIGDLVGQMGIPEDEPVATIRRADIEPIELMAIPV